MLHMNSLKIDNNIITLSDVPPKYNIISEGDSGASTHYWQEADAACLTNVRPYNKPSVILPDSDTIAPLKKGVLPLSSKLPIAAKMTTVLPYLKNSSLISLGQVCDDKCTVILDGKTLLH